jgi:hypothetical protein
VFVANRCKSRLMQVLQTSIFACDNVPKKKFPDEYIFIDFYKLAIDRNRYNMVIILVNHFSKRLFLIPYYKNINAKEVA